MKRDLLKIIEDKSPDFSKGQRRIAQYIAENYDKAAFLTAAKLGEAVNVSESTVVRFADELGFDGYPELQQALQEFVKNQLKSFQRVEVTNQLIGNGDALDKIMLSDIELIKQTHESIDRKNFNEAVDAIVNAKRIYIIGVRSSSSLAAFLNHNFRMIFDDVRFVQTTSGSEMFEQIIQMEKGDVLFAISFPRYSSRLINAVEYAKKHDVDVIALTDTEQSPIAQYADQLLLAQSDMVSFVNSLCAPLSIINAIVAAVSIKKQDDLTNRLRSLETIWDEYDVYDKINR